MNLTNEAPKEEFTAYSSPKLALESAKKESFTIKGVRKYHLGDTKLIFWSCTGSVIECSEDNILTANTDTWWDENDTFHK
jgi:hypothetical protein